MSQRWAVNEECAICGDRNYVRPLHGDAGGPMCCLLCIGQWHAEHGRRRRLGRIVIKAIKAFFDGGGKIADVNKLAASVIAGDLGILDIDPLGYLAGVAPNGDEVLDLTSELLGDVLQLVHPDHQPPERQELAQRVTKQLLALQPFVFPASPRPAPEPGAATVSPSGWRDNRDGRWTSTNARPRFPCTGCADTIPDYYCTPCRTQWDAEQQAERDRESAKRREWRQRRRARRPASICAACGLPFRGRRADARFCSDACRQRAHRRAVTDKHQPDRATLSSRDGADLDARAAR